MKNLSLVFAVVAGFGLSGCEQLLDWMYGGGDDDYGYGYGCEEDLYAPVCGSDGLTYGSPCDAEMSGVDIAHRGECDPEGCRSGWERGDRPMRCPPQPEPGFCNCDDSWYPVCNADGTMYPNPCAADCMGDYDVTPCEVDRPGDGCACPEYYSPVCDAAGNLYANRCFARCAGATDFGSCDGQGGDTGEGCVCTRLWDPVCGEDGNTYSNEGCAACEEVEVAYEGECAPPSRGR